MSFQGFEHIEKDWKKRTRESASNERGPKHMSTYGKKEIVAYAEREGPSRLNAERVGTSPKHSSEHQEQAALFKWAERNRDKYPELGSLYAVPNAAKRSKQVAAMMLAEGLKSGVPDICLPCPAGDFAALYIEMKYGYNKPTESQAAWIQFLRALGNRVEVCYSYEAARLVVCDYLNINHNKR